MAFSHPFFLIVRFSCVHGSCLLLMVRQLIVQPISFRACMVHAFFGRVCCPFSLSFQFLLTAISQPSAAQSVFPFSLLPYFGGWGGAKVGGGSGQRLTTWTAVEEENDSVGLPTDKLLGRKVRAVVMRRCWNEGMRTCKMEWKMRWKTMKNINKRSEKWSKKRNEINKS